MRPGYPRIRSSAPRWSRTSSGARDWRTKIRSRVPPLSNTRRCLAGVGVRHRRSGHMSSHDALGLVLLHGAMLARWIWERAVPRLARPALAVDFPGRGTVGEDDHAGAGRVGTGKRQIGVLSGPEQQRSVPDDDGVDPQLELVEQPVFEQRLTDATVPIKDDVLTLLRLELGDGGDDVGFDDLGGVPVCGLHGG